MKKNKNGFTLVEVLATISVLLLITMIAVPSIISIRNKQESNNDKEVEKIIIDATEIFYEMNKSKYENDIENESICINLNTIIKENYIKSPKILENSSYKNTSKVFVSLKKDDSSGEIEYNVGGCTSETLINKTEE